MRKGKGKNAREKLLRGSYTVEAAIIVSLYLLAAAAVMKAGMDMYREVYEGGDLYGADSAGLDDFYRVTVLKKTVNAGEKGK